MKKLWLLVIISAMLTTTAVAQDQKDVKQDKSEWEKKIKDELKLTPEQTVKYDAISKEYSEKMDAVMNDASSNKDAQKEKKMSLKKEKESRLMEILTPEQQTKYKEISDKKKKDMTTKTKV